MRVFNYSWDVGDSDLFIVVVVDHTNMWFKVVNGYPATLGRAREMALNKVDFPALGNPTNPK